MTFAFLSILDEYWWLVVFIVFWGIMFTGKRIDKLIDWVTDRKMKSLYGNFGDKYKDELFDYNAFLTKMLGAEIRLEDLIAKTEKTNEKIFKDELVRVTYLELWILVKIYGKHIVKSDEHIYYIDKRYFKKELELSFKEVNLWAMEFVNSKEIRDLKIEASFVLHKVRSNDPHCDPKMNAQSSAVEAVVFDKDYIFSSRKRIKGELESDRGIIKLSDGSIVEFDTSGYHFVGNDSDLKISDKINVITTSEEKTEAIKPLKEKVVVPREEKSQEEIVEMKSDGSVIKKDEGGREYVFKSQINNLKKDSGEMEDPEEDEIEIDLKVTEITVDKKIAEKIEKNLSSEEKGEQKTLDLDFFITEKIEKKKPEEKKVIEKNIPKKINNNKEEKNKEEDTLVNYKKVLDGRELISYEKFLEELVSNKHFLGTFFSKEDNEIYWDDITSTYYISITHLLIFISTYYVDKEEMRSAFFPEGNFHQGELETIIKKVATSYSEELQISSPFRREFHRADDGYKEIYTFSEIRNLDLDNFSDRIVKGKSSKKYRKAKIKKFAEQFLDGLE